MKDPMWPEIRRKFFHLTALIYVLALVFLPRHTYLLLLLALFTVVSISEYIRLHNAAVNTWWLAYFGALFREHEKHRPTGVLWMIAGVGLTVLMVPSVRLASVALLYLILGDAVASLAGKRLGGPTWPGSDKRLSGSLACFFVCLFIGSVLLRPWYGWHGIVIGALVAAATEKGWIRGDDNITIPVISSVALLLSYGIRPFF